MAGAVVVDVTAVTGTVAAAVEGGRVESAVGGAAVLGTATLEHPATRQPQATTVATRRRRRTRDDVARADFTNRAYAAAIGRTRFH
jgi:hypothetical protein